jgi:hypothetical protein
LHCDLALNIPVGMILSGKSAAFRAMRRGLISAGVVE